MAAHSVGEVGIGEWIQTGVTPAPVDWVPSVAGSPREPQRPATASCKAPSMACSELEKIDGDRSQ